MDERCESRFSLLSAVFPFPFWFDDEPAVASEGLSSWLGWYDMVWLWTARRDATGEMGDVTVWGLGWAMGPAGTASACEPTSHLKSPRRTGIALVLGRGLQCPLLC